MAMARTPGHHERGRLPAVCELLDHLGNVNTIKGGHHATLLVHAGKPRKGCMVASDKRFSDLAVRHFGDRERWRDIWELNNMTQDQPIRAGDCFLLPEK